MDGHRAFSDHRHDQSDIGQGRSRRVSGRVLYDHAVGQTVFLLRHAGASLLAGLQIRAANRRLDRANIGRNHGLARTLTRSLAKVVHAAQAQRGAGPNRGFAGGRFDQGVSPCTMKHGAMFVDSRLSA